MVTSGSIPVGASVVFVDGECVLCNRIASFIISHDRRGCFYFAHLQGSLAADALGRHGHTATDADSIYVLVGAGTANEDLLRDGRAARAIWPRIFWFAGVLRWVPLPVLDACYRAIARRRYRLFGRYDSCRMPTVEERARFLDLGPDARDPEPSRATPSREGRT